MAGCPTRRATGPIPWGSGSGGAGSWWSAAGTSRSGGCPRCSRPAPQVVLVSPAVTPAIEGMAAELTWHERRFEEPDLDGAWYVVAATDDPGVNAAVAAAAEERRIFCARADDARESSAWTMAAGHHGSVTVAVVGNREPRQSAALRDEIITALRDGHLSTTGALDHCAGRGARRWGTG